MLYLVDTSVLFWSLYYFCELWSLSLSVHVSLFFFTGPCEFLTAYKIISNFV